MGFAKKGNSKLQQKGNDKMKYTLYAWCADNEGGYGICNFGEFTPKRDYYPESGWRAEPSVKIGDFTTASELAILLYNNCPEWYKDENHAFVEATEMLQRRKEWEEEEAWENGWL